jgi:hypothetical protein
LALEKVMEVKGDRRLKQAEIRCTRREHWSLAKSG